MVRLHPALPCIVIVHTQLFFWMLSSKNFRNNAISGHEQFANLWCCSWTKSCTIPTDWILFINRISEARKTEENPQQKRQVHLIDRWLCSSWTHPASSGNPEKSASWVFCVSIELATHPKKAMLGKPCCFVCAKSINPSISIGVNMWITTLCADKNQQQSAFVERG